MTPDQRKQFEEMARDIADKAFPPPSFRNRDFQDDFVFGAEAAFDLATKAAQERIDIALEGIVTARDQATKAVPSHPLFSLVKPHLFWSRVSVKKANECWEWKGTMGTGGYGTISVSSGGKSRNLRAHRVSMFLFGNELPDDLMVDHKCRNRACVNPEHLRLVTARVNTLENSEAVTAKNASKTHCKYGHEFTKENTIDPCDRKGRECRQCRKRIHSEYNERRRYRRREASARRKALRIDGTEERGE